AAVRSLTETCDLDRAASVIAVRDGERVGLANLGLRGREAWVGGVGVVPAERRRGTGSRLMQVLHENARSHGVERVWLEVIVENSGAIALYEQLGDEHVRELEVWALAGAAGVRRTRRTPPRRTHGSASTASTESRGSATTRRLPGPRMRVASLAPVAALSYVRSAGRAR